MTIRALLFDFVGVLLLPDPGVDLGQPAEHINTIIGRVTDDRQFQAQTMADYQLSEAQFFALLQSITTKFVRFEPLWALLPGLRAHYRLAVINNGTYLTYPLFNRRFGLDDQFDAFICSANEGVCKPDPRIYQRASQMLGVPPAECLFMDDSSRNVSGAQQVGMQAICWQDPQAGFRSLLEILAAAVHNEG